MVAWPRPKESSTSLQDSSLRKLQSEFEAFFVLRDLRLKLRTRHSRISSCGYDDFLPLSKQFFSFIAGNSTLKTVVTEMLARNQPTVELVKNTDEDARIYGDTAEEAATVGYLKWSEFAAKANEFNFILNGAG